jgi:hypothetical protein
MTSTKLREAIKNIPGAVSLHTAVIRFASYARFLADYFRFRKLSRDGRFTMRWQDRYPCLDGKTALTGFDRHYLPSGLGGTGAGHDQTVVSCGHFVIPPLLHSGLRLCAGQIFDYRPASLSLSNLASERADICALPFADGHPVPFLHARGGARGPGTVWGPLDPEGDLKAMRELQRVLAAGGDLLFVVPVGKPRVMYNAHRIYSYSQVREYFAGLELREFALIPDDRHDEGLIRNASPEMADAQEYGCGCFWFRRNT